jgi:hypothetical protein
MGTPAKNSLHNMHTHEFHGELAVSTHWDARRRLVNWLASHGPVAGRWATVVPWDRHETLSESVSCP